MKKYFFFLPLLFFSVCGAVSAEESSGLSFSAPVLTPSLQFEAHYVPTEGNVYMSWKPWKGDMMWYKVVRSQLNPNPIYPEDESVCYSPDKNIVGCIDSSPLTGKTFYRICVITHERDRFCSNVVTINTLQEPTASEEKGEEFFCAQVITPAINIQTGECKEFPTPCDVPEGWETIEGGACSQQSFFLSATPQDSGAVYLTWKKIDIPQGEMLQLLKKEGEDSDLLSPFEKGVEAISLSEGQGYLDTNVLQGLTYSYRLCLPEGVGCKKYSNIVVIPLEDENLPTEPPAEMPDSSLFFSDVSPDTEEGAAILLYAEKGVVNGFSDGRFHPEKNVTRAEIAKMAVLASGSSLRSSGEQVFCDVPPDAWFFPYVEYFVEHNYASGFSGGNCDLGRFFSPHNPVLRSEALKMIVNIFHIDVEKYAETEMSFSDIPENHWVIPYVKAAVATGMINGDTFRPDEPATRGEVMLLLSRAASL